MQRTIETIFQWTVFHKSYLYLCICYQKNKWVRDMEVLGWWKPVTADRRPRPRDNAEGLARLFFLSLSIVYNNYSYFFLTLVLSLFFDHYLFVFTTTLLCYKQNWLEKFWGGKNILSLRTKLCPCPLSFPSLQRNGNNLSFCFMTCSKLMML